MEHRRRRRRRAHRKPRITLLRVAKLSAVVVLSVLVSVAMFYSGRYGIFDGLGSSEPPQE